MEEKLQTMQRMNEVDYLTESAPLNRNAESEATRYYHLELSVDAMPKYEIHVQLYPEDLVGTVSLTRIQLV